MTTTERLSVSADSLIMQNLRGAVYRKTVERVPDRIISMCVVTDHVFLSLDNLGIYVYRVADGGVSRVGRVVGDKSTCHDLIASTEHLLYIREVDDRLEVCVHDVKPLLANHHGNADHHGDADHHVEAELLDDERIPLINKCRVARRAPIALLSTLNLIIIGGDAWSKSWTTDASKFNTKFKDIDEREVVTLDIAGMQTVCRWRAVDHQVSLLRTQPLPHLSKPLPQVSKPLPHVSKPLPQVSRLAVADTRSGLTVYSLSSSSSSSDVASDQSRSKGHKSNSGSIQRVPEILCQIAANEIRDILLVGNDVAVFHRHEPNVTFWNMLDKRTILCINIQEHSVRNLSDELPPHIHGNDDVENIVSGITVDYDDHVTAVTSVALNSTTGDDDDDDDDMLVYGTLSGCVFGISVSKRLKLFSIPCPHTPVKGLGGGGAYNPRGVAMIEPGVLVVGYEDHGLTLMDFTPKDSA